MLFILLHNLSYQIYLFTLMIELDKKFYFIYLIDTYVYIHSIFFTN